MRVGVIGTGRMGAHHATALSSNPRVEQLVLFDRAQDRLEMLATELGARVAGDVAELLGHVDAVVIASPTASHEPLVTEAIGRQVAVLCEKPLARDLAGTRRLVELTATTSTRLQVGFHRRFDRSMRAGRDLVRRGELGRLYLLRATSHDATPPPAAFVASSGGIHADVQIHDIDLIRFLTGDEIVEVYATGAVLVDDDFATYGDIDVASLHLRLASGALATATATRHNARGYDAHVELFGSLDCVVLGQDARLPLRAVEADPPADPYRDFMDRFGPAYAAELDAFLEYAAGERPNPCTAGDAFAAQRVVVACDRSRREGRPVSVSEEP